MQSVIPSLGAYVHIGHGVQPVDWLVAEYIPAGHDSHMADPLLLAKFPTPHEKHLVGPSMNGYFSADAMTGDGVCASVTAVSMMECSSGAANAHHQPAVQVCCA